MPEFQRGVAVAYCDSPGPLDKGQKTFYRGLADSRKTGPTRRSTRSCANTTRARSTTSRSTRRCRATTCSSRTPTSTRRCCARCSPPGPFVEGWAVYTERVMADAGLPRRRPADAPDPAQVVPARDRQRDPRPGDPRRRHVARGGDEAHDRRHVPGRTRSRRQVGARAADSAQLPTYFVGAQEHLALRAEAETALGRRVRPASSITTRCCRTARRRCGSCGS